MWEELPGFALWYSVGEVTRKKWLLRLPSSVGLDCLDPSRKPECVPRRGPHAPLLLGKIPVVRESRSSWKLSDTAVSIHHCPRRQQRMCSRLNKVLVCKACNGRLGAGFIIIIFSPSFANEKTKVTERRQLSLWLVGEYGLPTCSSGKRIKARSPVSCLACSVAHPPSWVSSLGLYFPFCKMELLIPALPQGDSARSNRCYQIGEAFGDLTAQPSAANLLPASPCRLWATVPRGGNQTGQGFLDPKLCHTRSL